MCADFSFNMSAPLSSLFLSLALLSHTYQCHMQQKPGGLPPTQVDLNILISVISLSTRQQMFALHCKCFCWNICFLLSDSAVKREAEAPILEISPFSPNSEEANMVAIGQEVNVFKKKHCFKSSCAQQADYLYCFYKRNQATSQYHWRYFPYAAKRCNKCKIQ